jgi:hypothetical protein
MVLRFIAYNSFARHFDFESSAYNYKGQMKGLGDLAKKITKVTGVDYLVKKVVGEDCNCDERQAFLNKLVPFSKGEDIEDRAFSLAFVLELKERAETARAISRDEWLLMWDIYRAWVNPLKKNSDCKKCMVNSIDEMLRVLEPKK